MFHHLFDIYLAHRYIMFTFLSPKSLQQIPQFILEEEPENVKIVVAQPRRLAATGVANRVADERGEASPGKASVGQFI